LQVCTQGCVTPLIRAVFEEDRNYIGYQNKGPLINIDPHDMGDQFGVREHQTFESRKRGRERRMSTGRGGVQAFPFAEK